MYVTVFNPGQTPLVLDGRGRVLGGGEWGTARTTDSVTSGHLDSGALLKVDGDPDGDVSAGAGAALQRTAHLAARDAQIADLDKAALLKLARKNHLIGDDEDALKADLEELLVESDADLSVSKPTKKAAESGGSTK